MKTPPSTTVSAFDAKTHLSHLLSRVQKGECITITKHRVPIAVLIPAERSIHTPESIIEKIFQARQNVKLEGISSTILQEKGRA